MLTDKVLRTLQPRARPYRVFDKGTDPGFHVQVTPAGKITFAIQYRDRNGKTRFARLGSYPAIKLPDARSRCRQLRKELDNGIDPASARSNKLVGSVADLLALYIDDMRRRGRRYWSDVERDVKGKAFPQLDSGRMPAKDVTPAHISDILAEIIDRRAVVHANRVRSYLRRMFQIGLYADNDPARRAAVRFGLTVNPVDSVPRQIGVELAKTRILTSDEIKQAWSGIIAGEEIAPGYRLALRWMFANGGQRSGESLGICDTEIIQPGLWNLPPERTKNGRRHLVPITTQGLTVLSDARAMIGTGPQYFPARFDPTATKSLRSDTVAHNIQDWQQRAGVAAGDRWTARDIRRTIKTLMAEIGIPKQIRDLIQNHAVKRDVADLHYDQYDYLKEKRAALNALEVHLLTILQQERV